MLVCDGCGCGGHLSCVRLDAVPEGDWFCPLCRSARKRRGTTSVMAFDTMPDGGQPDAGAPAGAAPVVQQAAGVQMVGASPVVQQVAGGADSGHGHRVEWGGVGHRGRRALVLPQAVAGPRRRLLPSPTSVSVRLSRCSRASTGRTASVRTCSSTTRASRRASGCAPTGPCRSSTTCSSSVSLAGARVDLRRHAKQGDPNKSGPAGRTLTHEVDHWQLAIHFNKVWGEEDVIVTKLAKPEDVSTDIEAACGYYDYDTREGPLRVLTSL